MYAKEETDLPFHFHDEEFHRESDVVSGLPSMPHCKEYQGAQVTDEFRTDKLQSFENVLSSPLIG